MVTLDDTACPLTVGSNQPARVGHNCVTTAAEAAWKALAPLMAARPAMRLWTTHEDFDHACDLTQKLPDRPAAVPLYVRGRARMLVFDLDAKQLGAQAVVRDMRRIVHWVNECGGLAVVDESTSGGMHVLVPLRRAVTVEEVRPLLQAASARCPTLDAAPMLNAKTGCITVPGSPCREGGHRRLAGTLDAAQHAFAQRSSTHFLTAINALLGTALLPSTEPSHQLAPPPGVPEAFDGQDIHTQTLRPVHRNHTPLPTSVETFARTGTMPTDRRWPTRSEARQSVLVHAMWRGASLTDVQQATAGPWTKGLGAAYLRYGVRANRILRRDWISAQRWLVARLSSFHPGTHKKQHNGPTGTPVSARWLAHAIWWCDLTLRSHPQRWAVTAVLQALAVSAARAGEVINGVAVVAVGGRSLSIAAGLLSESTVWAVLRLLRETPGSPVLLIAKGSGLTADRYALTEPSTLDPAPFGPGRPVVHDVHPAWAVIGHQHRRTFEMIMQTGAHTAREIAQSARMSASATYESVAELARYGLITRTHGVVRPGPTTLDDIAHQYRLDEERAQRIARHRQDRQTWRQWLSTRRDPGPDHPVAVPPSKPVVQVLSDDDELAYRSNVMATGPPDPLIALW